jgi:hypothetical protein
MASWNLVKTKTPQGVAVGLGVAAVAHKRVYRYIRYRLTPENIASEVIKRSAKKIIGGKLKEALQGAQKK